MKEVKTILISAIVAIAVVWFGSDYLISQKNGTNVSQEHESSHLDNILENGTLRCGYYVFPPVTYRDPETDELSGLSVDMMELIGRRLGLEIEWVEEITFGNWSSALQSGRFDVTCTPIWAETAHARVVNLTNPMMFSGLSPVVRNSDQRFDQGTSLDRFNAADVTFLTQDGSGLKEITRQAFPQAKIHNVPSMMDGPTAILEIVTGKADAILLDRNGVIMYNANNSDTLKMASVNNPVKLQPFTLAVPKQAEGLRDLLNHAIDMMVYDGSLDRLISKWEPEPNTFLRREPPVKGVD